MSMKTGSNRDFRTRLRSKRAPVNYLKRLCQHMPRRLSRSDRQALDEAERGER